MATGASWTLLACLLAINSQFDIAFSLIPVRPSVSPTRSPLLKPLSSYHRTFSRTTKMPELSERALRLGKRQLLLWKPHYKYVQFNNRWTFRYMYPTNRRKILLYCRTGYLLEILPRGKVSGTVNVSSQYAVMELQVINSRLKRIKGVASNRYLAINKRGKLVTKTLPTRETLFEEDMLENYFHTLKSYTYPKSIFLPRWYVGLRPNGHTKRASRALNGETVTQFQYIYLRH